jgi:molecular chaperone Hsp33
MAIRIKKDGTTQSGLVDDNVVQPFRLEKSNIRGRMVRVSTVLEEIMRRHNYPPPVSALLGEVVTLGLLLSAMLKYDGIFTLQIKGDGPIRMLVADVTPRGEVRAWASFDEQGVKKAARRKQDTKNHYYHLLGKKGYIAFTVDPGDIEKRYQGIVELKGESITDAVQHYFTQSEQVKTSFKIAVHPQDSLCKTAAVMIQQMPEEGAAAQAVSASAAPPSPPPVH